MPHDPDRLLGYPRERVLHELDLQQVADEFGGAREVIVKLSRRSAMKAFALAATGALLAPLAGLLPSSAYAGDEGDGGRRADQFIFPRLQFVTVDGTGKHWDGGPSGDVILRQKLKEMTNVDVSLAPKVVRLADFDDMCRNPFVFMTAGGSFTLPANEEKNLREFLKRGGFILADDCMGVGGGNDTDAFFRCYSKMLNRLHPENQLRLIPLDHEIYRIFFKFADGCPHMQGVKHGAHGLFEPGTGRLMSIVTPGDLHCGWMCRSWFGPTKDLEAIKMGLNIIIYYLTH